MKQLTTYCCETCGTIYMDEEECKKCEAFHVKPDTAVLVRFEPHKEANIPYPESIVFKMQDDKHARYTFLDIVKVDENGGIVL